MPVAETSSASNVPANWLRECSLARMSPPGRNLQIRRAEQILFVAPIFSPVSTSRLDDTGDIRPRVSSKSVPFRGANSVTSKICKERSFLRACVLMIAQKLLSKKKST